MVLQVEVQVVVLAEVEVQKILIFGKSMCMAEEMVRVVALDRILVDLVV